MFDEENGIKFVPFEFTILLGKGNLPETNSMKTCLYDQHRSLNAKFFDFNGWQMPLYYQGIAHEHMNVRQKVGLFDLSHMGRISIMGKQAAAFLDFLSTNRIIDKQPGSVTYSIFTSAQGYCLDDVLIYSVNKEHFFFIANAANRDKDLAHLLAYASNWEVEIKPHFEEEGILAIQGPESVKYIEKFYVSASTLPHMHFIAFDKGFISRTGYTGEDGFEIFASISTIQTLWKNWIEKKVMPCGLGARDTLRLEMGYALYGNEISDSIYPTESLANWTVKLKERDFLGKKALFEVRNLRHAYGIVLNQGIARSGYPVYTNGEKSGYVTSGNYSFCLKKGIALILNEKKITEKDKISLEIRNQKVDAKLSFIPFLKTGIVHEIHRFP